MMKGQLSHILAEQGEQVQTGQSADLRLLKNVKKPLKNPDTKFFFFLNTNGYYYLYPS